MRPYLIDTHSHLHFPAFKEDRELVLTHMREKRIATITVGTNVATSLGAVEFAKKHRDVFATVGYHPEHFTSSYIDPDEKQDDVPYSIERIKKVAVSNKNVVAIGETGLDFYRIDEDRDRREAETIQTNALREHIDLAHELKLPIVIHCRDAFHMLAEIVQDEQNHGKNVLGVVHCFTGSWTEAQPLLDLGLSLSFSGVITFPQKKSADPDHSIHRVIERMPTEQMLVETDAPWLTPVPHRGKRNEPLYVEYVVQKIAEILNMERDEIADITTQNALKLFSRIDI